MNDRIVTLEQHRTELLSCRRCPRMVPPSIAGPPVSSRILLLGQAPGIHEGELGRPFAWTAGKTLFEWFEKLGVKEVEFRRKVYMAAVCRCFPGRLKSGGDRVPSRVEIENCEPWLGREVGILRPTLLIPVGRLAISRVLSFSKLVDVVGTRHRATWFDRELDVVPLPHPSGASTWHRTDPGLSLLALALDEIARHPTFEAAFAGSPAPHGTG